MLLTILIKTTLYCVYVNVYYYYQYVYYYWAKRIRVNTILSLLATRDSSLHSFILFHHNYFFSEAHICFGFFSVLRFSRFTLLGDDYTVE
jgi:hypothetical protein